MAGVFYILIVAIVIAVIIALVEITLGKNKNVSTWAFEVNPQILDSKSSFEFN